jgi:hypothetical protein
LAKQIAEIGAKGGESLPAPVAVHIPAPESGEFDIN